MAVKILVVDDEEDVCAVLSTRLEGDGFDVLTALDGAAALALFRKERPATVLLDLVMPGLDGMRVLSELKRADPDIPVIICTGHADIPSAVEVMRLGAYDCLTKPFNFDLVLLSVRRAVERHQLWTHIEELKSQGEGASLADRMGRSAEIQRVIQQVTRVARSTFTVLVQGETGTGKELVARAIHQQSARAEGPFVVIDCATIPETLIESELFGHEKGAFTGAMRRKDGLFQLAEGGTLFLDEIGNVPLAAQAKLLRAIEGREVYALGGVRPMSLDVRIIAASNVRFDEEIKAGRFRRDLYYRLSEFTIELPPLRERREDVGLLARRFLAEACMELRSPVRGFSDETMEILLGYDWPGNARELKNVVRRAALMTNDMVAPEHLPVLAPGRSAGRDLMPDPNLAIGNQVVDAANGALPSTAHDVVQNVATSLPSGTPGVAFDQFILTDEDINVLRAYAKARGTYLQGAVTFNSSNLLPYGLVFVDTVSGANITKEGVSPATPLSDFASASIHGNAGSGTGGVFSGWLFVNGTLSISGNFVMNGFAYSQNDISYHGTGTGQLTGAMLSRNIRDLSSTSIDSDLLGNAAIVYNCQAVKTGGGAISATWLFKGGTYKEVSGS